MRKSHRRSKRRFWCGKVAENLQVTDLFTKEDGFTTVGVVVALMVTLTLVFTAAQVYRVNSLSADVQDVADAAVLAAENEVAEFMVAVQVCDAVVLSMNLLSLGLAAVGIIAACMPTTASLSIELLDLSRKTLDARDSFAEKAAGGLNKMQDALPILASANAASVAAANNGGIGASSYSAVALLMPEKGEPIEVGDAEEARQAEEEAIERSDEIRENAAEIERLTNDSLSAAYRAYDADCGAYPERCMMERGEKLAGLSGYDNPWYASTESGWSFSVPLARAKSYFAARAAQGISSEGSVADQARSVLRHRYYEYMSEKLEAEAYVHDDENGFEANFPTPFKNMDEFRATPLYREAIYPITQGSDGAMVMHAWSGCPEAQAVIATGSIAQMEEDAMSFGRCSACEFRPSTLGNVASASTNINSGFEHFYREVAEAAEEYQKVREELDPLQRETEEECGSLIDNLLAAAESLVNKRIEATPPGSTGAIALVVDAAHASASAGFENPFTAEGEMGVRAAVAGAAMVADPAEEDSSVIANLLDGFGEDGGAAVGAARQALDIWSGLLKAYNDGYSFTQSSLFNWLMVAVHGVSSSDLRMNVQSKLIKGIEALGFAPAKLDALKPVLVNSAVVAAADDGGLATRFRSIQQRARDASSGSTDLFDGLVQTIEGSAYEDLDRVAEGIKVAEIDLPFLSKPYPVVVKLPEALLNGARSTVEDCTRAIRDAYASVTGRRVWE